MSAERSWRLTKEDDDEYESYFIRCDCYGHLLNIAINKDDINEEFGMVVLTSYDTDVRYSWRNRFRAIWRLLRYGDGGGREIVLMRGSAIALGQKIVELGEMLRGEESGS